MKENNIIVERSFEFSLKIIELFIELKKQNEFVLSKQILRSGTSIGANVEEGIAAYSKAEFSHKMGIALKEAREVRYWMRLLDKSQLVPGDYSWYIQESTEIMNILGAIVSTSRGK
jgi:four helix bundle protein